MTRLCSILKDDTEKREKPNTKKQAFDQILKLNKELDLKSPEGTKWNREEWYDRY